MTAVNSQIDFPDFSWRQRHVVEQSANKERWRRAKPDSVSRLEGLTVTPFVLCRPRHQIQSWRMVDGQHLFVSKVTCLDSGHNKVGRFQTKADCGFPGWGRRTKMRQTFMCMTSYAVCSKRLWKWKPASCDGDTPRRLLGRTGEERAKRRHRSKRGTKGERLEENNVKA